MNFGGFNLDKAKEMFSNAGGSELNGKLLINLLQNIVNQPDKGKELLNNLNQETNDSSNILETIQKLFSYAKKFGLI